MQLLIGFCLGAVIGFLAWRAGALSDSGALAAALTGGLIFGLGGWPWAALLLMFFVSSSGLSRLFTHRKAALDEKFAKGSRRDWGQVFANGGLGALLAVVYARFPDYPCVWAAYVGAMAAVNADTWSTELGVLSRTPPRLITSGKMVERGTSGGISFLGTLAALGGAVLIGATALVVGGGTPWLVGIAALGGLAGALFDSFLGASVQAIYYCPACQKETERTPRHLCGAQTQPLRGWSWLNNDWVNFACSLVGAGVSVLIWMLFQ